MQEVLLACPQPRDRREVAAAGLDRRFRVRFAGPDLDAAPAWDAEALVTELAALPVDGIVGTKDRSALVAALAGARSGLPGPEPAALVRCQHKPTARAVAREAVPDATPAFGDVEPAFVKPAVGRLSQSYDEEYVRGWLALARLAGFDGDVGLLAEEVLTGAEVTLEGYVHDGRVTTVGVTDSVMYPGTGSFERFEYPSALPPERLAELSGVAERLLPALGFDGGFFNVEFFVPEAGPAKLTEVNGRIASQFAPLIRALHGRSTYEALLELACGRDPGWDARRPDGVAVSHVLRAFEDAFVEGVPDPEDGVEVLVEPGRRLSEQDGPNDGASYRLAIVVGAEETRDEAVIRCRERARRLAFRLAPP